MEDKCNNNKCHNKDFSLCHKLLCNKAIIHINNNQWWECNNLCINSNNLWCSSNNLWCNNLCINNNNLWCNNLTINSNNLWCNSQCNNSHINNNQCKDNQAQISISNLDQDQDKTQICVHIENDTCKVSQLWFYFLFFCVIYSYIILYIINI